MTTPVTPGAPRDKSSAGRSERAPALETTDYLQDKVQRIVKTEVVPEPFSDIGRVDAWRTMVRAHAFEELLRVIKPDQTFTVQCIAVEYREPTATGQGQQLVIGCELHYKIERK